MKTILFTGNGANRLEQLISMGCSEGWSRSNAVATNGPGLSIGLLAARRLYTGVVGGCTRGVPSNTRGWVMVVPISSVHSLLRSPSRATIFRWVTPMVPKTRGHFAYWILVLRGYRAPRLSDTSRKIFSKFRGYFFLILFD